MASRKCISRRSRRRRWRKQGRDERREEDRIGALAPGCVGILGRRSLRPQLNPHALAPEAGGPDGGLLLLPPGGIYHAVHKSACLTSPAQSLHPKVFTLPPWPSITRLPDATAANTRMTSRSESGERQRQSVALRKERTALRNSIGLK